MTPDEKHLYLASEGNNEHVPNGINLMIVDEEASRDRTRRQFYEFLGIPPYKPWQVCNIILEIHARAATRGFNPPTFCR